MPSYQSIIDLKGIPANQDMSLRDNHSHFIPTLLTQGFQNASMTFKECPVQVENKIYILPNEILMLSLLSISHQTYITKKEAESPRGRYT